MLETLPGRLPILLTVTAYGACLHVWYDVLAMGLSPFTGTGDALPRKKKENDEYEPGRHFSCIRRHL
jgi:hypothetical protein